MKNELLPCPFCGMRPEFNMPTDSNVIGIVCPEGSPCRGSALFICFDSTNRESAIAAWNRRVLPEQQEGDGTHPNQMGPWT